MFGYVHFTVFTVEVFTIMALSIWMTEVEKKVKTAQKMCYTRMKGGNIFFLYILANFERIDCMGQLSSYLFLYEVPQSSYMYHRKSYLVYDFAPFPFPIS